MADTEDVESVEISMTTLMKIVKHCRQSGNKEATGVIMGSVTDGVCFVGNCFPNITKGSDKKAKTKLLRDPVDDATKYFGLTNYDSNICGLYINIPNGKFYSSDFMHQIITEKDKNLANNAKI